MSPTVHLGERGGVSPTVIRSRAESKIIPPDGLTPAARPGRAGERGGVSPTVNLILRGIKRRNAPDGLTPAARLGLYHAAAGQFQFRNGRRPNHQRILLVPHVIYGGQNCIFVG